MSKEAMKLALEALEYIEHNYMSLPAPAEKAITALREALAEQPAQQEKEAFYVYKPTLPRGHLGNVSDGDLPWVYDQDPSSGYSARMFVYTTPPAQQEPVTVLPDGSAFAVMSYPLPKDHWLYADRQYNDGEYEPVELGKPVLTHELRDTVVSAVRYAIRGATNCGKEVDFDPDALVQNAVYALCGPFTSPPTLSLAQRSHECSRSHPHENMNAMCELRTEIARLTNENARLKAMHQDDEINTYRMTLLCIRDGLQQGMSKSIQKLQAREINDVLGLPSFASYRTSPPAQRTWVGLTDEQIDRLWSQSLADTEGETWLPLHEFARAIEAKLKEKNT